MAAWIVAAAVLPLVAGCLTPGGGGNEGDGASEPLLVHASQAGDSNVFDPTTLKVAVGDKVTWDVTGAGHHTVTFHTSVAPGGPVPDSDDVGLGSTFDVTFPAAGSYEYYCRYHSNGKTGMVGTIVVE
ncbi:MAG: hypothetical protein HY556_03085 [Euryarchaeota archaeon]|nr:hypothetical protein [Euryarchaeota archaeon]